MCKIATIAAILALTGTANNYGINSIVASFDNFIRVMNSTVVPPQIQQPTDRRSATTHIGEYDFIIVGSGSSGAVLANRLSENPAWKILLLEAGNPGNKFTKIPIWAPIFQLTPYNWYYNVERQNDSCLGMIDQICAWPRGKALGGTSVINYMIYTRGNPIDYARWAQGGNSGWSYEEVLPYYLKSEGCNGLEMCPGEYHSDKGPWSVTYPYLSKTGNLFLKAGAELGHRIVDYNTRNYMGFGRIQTTQQRGRRHSTADAYLYPFLGTRPNLKVITSARVTRLVIDKMTKQAKGVEFRKRGTRYCATTIKEVVLSAGTFNSPQLLMLSGIGPRDHLNALGIEPLVDLPVGQLLKDHLSYLGLAFRLNQTVESLTTQLLDPSQMLNWLLNGKGVYTSLAGVEAIAYVNTRNPHDIYPDIELLFAGIGSLESDLGLVVSREIRLKPHIYDKVFKPLENQPVWTVLPMLLHPKSNGRLTLRSKDPYEPPVLEANYLREPEDLETFLRAIRLVQKLSRTETFQRYGSRIHDVPIPGCEHLQFDSDEYWRCCVRTLSASLHHQIGTCKMGPEGEAVVDPRLKVWGVTGLRVIDSSVIPVTLSAHTSAPAVMIGEKGADLIKEDWLD